MWVFNSVQRKHDGVHFYIGAVKIAEIQMSKNAKKWKYYLRLMFSSAAYDIKDHYETFSDALKDLHRLLNSPGPEI